MSNNAVLLVDEKDARRGLHAFGLRCAGFTTEEASSTAVARACIAERCPALVLVAAARVDDRICELAAALRADAYTRDLPLLTLVEQAGRVDAGTAYQCGVSDYLLEPVAPEELVSRIRAALECRRSPDRGREQLADLTVDAERSALRRGSRLVPLRPAERRLLAFLLAHPDQVIPRDLLLFRVWGGGANQDSRVVDVTVCRLRRALQAVECQARLQTVSRHGYKFSQQGESHQ
jgi:two-component system phosphate regulon response regulator PhoB